MATRTSVARLQRLFNVGIVILLIISGLKIVLFYLWFDHQGQFKQASEVRYKVHDVANAMRQNSDYLSRMARNFVVTGDMFAKKQFLATLAIRRKQSSHPQFYRIETSDTQNATEPDIIKDQEDKGVFIDQLHSVGLSGDGKAIVEAVEYGTDTLAMLMIEAYYAMEGKFKDTSGKYTISGQPDQKRAIAMLYGNSYNTAKNRVTNQLNISFNKLEAISWNEVEFQHKMMLRLLYIIFATFIIVVSMLVFLFVVNSRLKNIIVDDLNNKVDVRTRELQLINEQYTVLNEEMETQNEELSQLNEELIQTNESLYEQQRITTEAKEQFEQLFNVNPDAVIITNASTGKLIQVNLGCAKLFGFTMDMVLGKTATELNLWGSIEDRGRFVAETNEKGNLTDFETKLRRMDGTLFDAIVSTTTIDINGTPHIISVVHDISTRKQYEEALCRSEALYHDLVETSQDLIWQCDADGRYTYLNSSWQNVLGYTIEEMIGRKYTDFQTSEQIAIDEQKIASAMRSGTLNGLETIHIGKSGNEIHLVFNAKSIVGNDGSLIGARGAAYNITDRKRAENTLTERNQFIESLITVIPEILYIYDIPEQKTIFSNDRIVQILGYSPAEIREMGFQAMPVLMHPEDCAHYFDNIIPQYRTLAEGTQIQHLFRMKTKSGQWKWIETVEIVFKRAADSSPLQIFGAGRDVTDSKLAHEKIKYQERFLRTLTDNIPGMVGYWTRDLICGFANGAYFTWFGKTNEEMIGGHLIELLGETLYSKSKTYIDSVLRGIPQNFERIMTKTNGEHGYTWIHYIPDFKDGEVVGFYVLVSDITEIKEAELKIQKQNTALIESNSSKDKLFSIIAHDLRGPLGSLRLLNKILIENISNYDREAILEMITMFDKVISQTYFLLENLLEWSRLQRGLISAKPERCRINALVGDIVVLLGEKARSKNITLCNAISATLLADCDTNMTKTIIRNLMSNALKFSDKGSTVTITATLDTNFLEMSVEDNGQGIAADKIPNLFDIIANQTTIGTDNESGTGLGLPLCKEMAEKQGGKIWVVSEEGRGSSFFFTIKQ